MMVLLNITAIRTSNLIFGNLHNTFAKMFLGNQQRENAIDPDDDDVDGEKSNSHNCSSLTQV
jgi:hypothetical protein